MGIKSWTTVAYIIATGFMTVVQGTYLLFKKIDHVLLLELEYLCERKTMCELAWLVEGYHPSVGDMTARC